MRIRNLFAFLSLSLTNQPALVPDASVHHIIRQHDNGDRTQAFVDEWNAMRIPANVAADFYRRSEKPSAKAPRSGDPRQAQFYDQPFIKAAAFFRRAGAEIAIGAVDPARLSVIGGDAALWLSVLREQERSRWDRERKVLFAQAVTALRVITDEDRLIRSACYWEALEIEGFDVDRFGDEIIVEVRVFNPNDTDCPVPPFLLTWLLTGLSLIEWPPKQASIRKGRSKIKFKLRREADGALEVTFARTVDIH